MTSFLRLAALAALMIPFAASAQSGDRAEQRLERLTERLDLTDAQVAIVRETMTEAREQDGRRRGASWTLAARLAPTMSDAQLTTIRDGLANRAENRRQRGEQARERRADRGESPRDAALGLSDAQKEALADLRAERRADRSELPAQVSQILTDEQEAVLLVHRALSPPRGMRGGPRGARRGGPRR
ncbi:MAG: hypothetical protein AAGI52_01725 [Bacteroidota bacterium]